MRRFPMVAQFVVIAFATTANSLCAAAEQPSPAGPVRKGIALAIGLNSVDPRQYVGWSGCLQAAENDAKDMAAIAQARDFRTSILLTDQATRAKVIDEIKKTAASMQPGDAFLLTYSGHGGQIPDRNGDEADNQDETMCLYDGELLDDELAALWVLFPKGCRIVVIADCCYSGTILKYREFARCLDKSLWSPADATAFTNRFRAFTSPTAEPNAKPAPSPFRSMPPAIAKSVFEKHREFYAKLGKDTPSQKTSEKSIQATVLLISACQEDQPALDGEANSLFTGTLRRVWNDGQFSGTYPRFYRAIVERMPPFQTPNYEVIGAPNPAFEAETPFSP